MQFCHKLGNNCIIGMVEKALAVMEVSIDGIKKHGVFVTYVRS